MFASIQSCALSGVKGVPIRVEVHSSSGIPGFSVVGMPDTLIRESKDRIRSALISSRLGWPDSRMTINLAPASVRKSGTGAELAILVGLLCTSGKLNKKRFENSAVFGELGLDGTIREVSGTIARVHALKELGIQEIFVPKENAYEASLIKDINIMPLNHISDLISALCEGLPLENIEIPDSKPKVVNVGDFKEITAQPMLCESMQLLAAGGHHTLLMGSPGIGKTMAAERLPSILPDLETEESIEVSAIKSIVSGKIESLERNRPFINPHHSASHIALTGGGSQTASPGEITRAHKGVLFLDELSEFSTHAIDMLRQPLEKGYINIARANFSTQLPADFIMLACSNPCPCAKARDKCICSDSQRSRYLRKLSGPLLDRFDIRLEIYKTDYIKGSTHNSTEMKRKVQAARKIQLERNEGKLNSRLSSSDLRKYTPLSKKSNEFFKDILNKREISARGATSIWRVARTIADINQNEEISELDLSNAFDFREEIK